MGLADKLRDLAVRLEISNDSVFAYPIKKQKQYIAHFHAPKDDIQRSYYQYKCQMKFNNPIIALALNVVSLPILLFYLRKNGSTPSNKDLKNSIFFSDGKPANIIPEVLKDKVGKLEIINEKKESLTKEDKEFILSLWKQYPFSFQFILKCLLKIRYYSYEIQRVHPNNIIVCNEYSFTSSVLTKYCEQHRIKHINVMHGEKIYYMRDSFFHFHECYVWDEYYRDLFLQMRAEISQFKVAVPPSLKFPVCNPVQKDVKYTYYLGWESGEKLETIVKVMDKLRQKGIAVSIRPHPRYSDLNEIKGYAPEIEIEDYKLLSIEQSLMRTENAVSVYSTVLNQAYNNGIGIVIDDISDKQKVERLSERQYIMLNNPHKLLSDLLEIE